MRETELLWAAVLTSVTIALERVLVTSAGEKRLLHWTGNVTCHTTHMRILSRSTTSSG